MQNAELLAQYPPHREQRFDQNRMIEAYQAARAHDSGQRA
jgi:hypothetical protein